MPQAPGLYFVGLHWLFSMSSVMIHGVGRDADRIAGLVHQRTAEAEPATVRAIRPSAAA
jgi:putative flavoprotein involved in K+ transport